MYRARDTRLDRTVAIKILPSHLSDTEGLRQRFEREARSISSLNHPHICHLYDIGSQSGTDYLVMEYLEGETLAQRLEKGPLPLEQGLKIAIEIADALDRAHRQNIIHRDLKPSNVMLTKSGAKLMDFGLAKPAVAALGPAAISPTPITPSTPTLTAGALALSAAPEPLTRHGTIVGTFQYMAPEVLQGAEADARSDIFSFGCLVYEMVTGKKAFEGKSQISVLAAILEKEPEPIITAQPSAPTALQSVIDACLTKDPEQRIQSAHDLRLQVQLVRDTTRPIAQPVAARTRRWFPLAAGVLLLLLVAVGVFWWFHPQTNEAADFTTELSITMPPGIALSPLSGPAISPDGKTVVFVARTQDGTDALYLRRLDSTLVRRLEGTEMASYPFWSPDSASIGFFAAPQLRRVDIASGVVEPIADAPDGRGGTWNDDGVIIFAPHTSSPLFRVSASGGKPQPLTDLNGNQSHRWPSFLPDGQHFVYTAQPGAAPGGIYLASLDDPKGRLLTGTVINSQPVGGYLLFGRGATVLASKLDLKAAKLAGENILVANGVRVLPDRQLLEFSAAPNGAFTYATGDTNSSQLGWFDRKGQQLETLSVRNSRGELDLSRDGRRLLTDYAGPEERTLGVAIIDLQRGSATSVERPFKSDESAVWSPAGESVVLSSKREGENDLVRRWIDGSEREQILVKSSVSVYPDDWAKDGRWLLYEQVSKSTNFDLMLLDLQTGGKPQAYLQSPANEAHARISPDGRWAAYVSDESGRAEVYVQSFPVPGRGKWQVSTQGGNSPYWRGDGGELYYVAPDLNLMAVPIRPGTSFDPGIPVKLFNTRVEPSSVTGSRNSFVAAPDGKRFLVQYIPQQAGGGVIGLVLNWQQRLKQRPTQSGR